MKVACEMYNLLILIGLVASFGFIAHAIDAVMDMHEHIYKDDGSR